MPSSKGGSKSSSTHSQKNGKKVGKSAARPAPKSAVQSGAKASAAVSLKAGKAAAKSASKPASKGPVKKVVSKKVSAANTVSAKNRVTVGAVEVAKSLKKAISGVLKVAHAPAALTQGKAEVKAEVKSKIKAGKSAVEPTKTKTSSISEMTGVVLAAQTQSAVKSTQAPELTQKGSSKGSSEESKELTKKSQPEKKTLARTRVANKKSSDAKKYHGAILLKFEDGSCRDAGCESHATTGQYCRMHYIKNWKKIKQREELMKEGTLNRFIEELVAKYPDKYIEAIRHDLAHDQEFAKVVADLEIDDAAEPTEEFADDEDSNSDHFIEHIRRDFGEGDGEAF